MIAVSKNVVAEVGHNDIVTVDRFLSPSVCRRLLTATAAAAWRPSRVAMSSPALETELAQPTGRLSSTIILRHPDAWIASALRRIEQSLRATFDIDPAHLEPWQVTRYKRGEAYDYHLDCGCWRGHASGERKRTILIYIEQPIRGGATDFRALHYRIPALAGRLVVWDNLLANGNCNHAMIHSGRPVWQGRKTILTTWEREGPLLPKRSGGASDK